MSEYRQSEIHHNKETHQVKPTARQSARADAARNRRSKVAAARSVKAMRTLYKFADENELYTGRNVAKAVRVEDTQPRRRFLSPDEQARVRAALDDPSLAEWVKPLMLLALSTGARRTNLCSMRWDALDLDAGVYRVKAADSKNKIPMDIVLPPEAVAILRERQKKATSEWVFPSPKASSVTSAPNVAEGRPERIVSGWM